MISKRDKEDELKEKQIKDQIDSFYTNLKEKAS